VLASTKGVPRRSLWVSYGILGIAGACAVAFFASEITALFEGAGQELLNAGILLLAVGMLTSKYGDNAPRIACSCQISQLGEVAYSSTK